MTRLAFMQSETWFQSTARHVEGVYADDRCCHCFRKVKPHHPRLLTARTNDGEWWVVSADEDMAAPEWRDFQDQLDGTFKPTPLPVGPHCLRKYPEWRFAVALTG